MNDIVEGKKGVYIQCNINGAENYEAIVDNKILMIKAYYKLFDNKLITQEFLNEEGLESIKEYHYRYSLCEIYHNLLITKESIKIKSDNGFLYIFIPYDETKRFELIEDNPDVLIIGENKEKFEEGMEIKTGTPLVTKD